MSAPQAAVQSIVSSLERHGFVLLGKGLELFDVPLPPALAGKTLRDAGIRARPGSA